MNEAPAEFTPPARFSLFGKALEPLRDAFNRRLSTPHPQKSRLGFFDIVLGVALGSYLHDLFDDD